MEDAQDASPGSFNVTHVRYIDRTVSRSLDRWTESIIPKIPTGQLVFYKYFDMMAYPQHLLRQIRTEARLSNFGAAAPEICELCASVS